MSHGPPAAPQQDGAAAPAVEMVQVAAAEALGAVTSALRAAGAGEAEASAQAHMLVEAELRGRPSHGLQRLPTLIGRIRRGVLRPRARPVRSWRAPGLLEVDGGGGFGPHVAGEALALAMGSIERSGIVLVAIGNSSHLGMLAPYVETIAAKQLIGIALTTSEALVHPAGGRVALIGTNPIAIGIPVRDEPPFVLDMSTGAISAGAIIAHAQRGQLLPPGCAVDRDGRETRDAERALEGAISPAGGVVGFGLGLAIELIVATLTRTALGADVVGTLDVERPATKGDVFVLIDPGTDDEHGGRVARYLDQVRASAPALGSAGVRIPGERARRERDRRLRAGLPLPRALWATVTALAAEGASGDRRG